MEFLEGETLAERLRKGPLPVNEILKIGIAVAEALAVAHRQGIVHRDLKPGNSMLTRTFRSAPKLSPDGHWLAYMSNESGLYQIYVVAFNGGHGKWQVSVNASLQPSWSHNGKELYFVDAANSVYAVPVKEVAGALQFGTPQALVSTWSMPVPFYQISPDDKKILLYRISQQIGDSITVVTNFSSILKK